MLIIYIYTCLIGMQCHLFLMGETAIQSVYHAVGFRDVCLCVCTVPAQLLSLECTSTLDHRDRRS